MAMAIQKNCALRIIGAVEAGLVPWEKMLLVGQSAGNDDVWEKIVEKIDWEKLSLGDILLLGQRAGNRVVWIAVGERIVRRFNDSKMTEGELTDFVGGAVSIEVFQEIFESIDSKKLSTGGMIILGALANDSSLWEVVAEWIEGRKEKRQQ